jgi:hypothetical protein
MQWSAG